MAKVAIIISTYNRVKELEKTLMSLHQSLKGDKNDVHVIVYDDGSCDGTFEFLNERIEFFDGFYSPRFNLIRAGDVFNRGLRTALNESLRIAFTLKPKYISYMQDDIDIEPGWLQKCIDVYNSSEKIGLVTGHDAPEHPVIKEENGIKYKKTCRATHLFASTKRWKEFGEIPDLTPGIAAPKPGKGSLVDWWLVGHPERKYPESDNSIQNKKELIACIPKLITHRGSKTSTWGNILNPELE